MRVVIASAQVKENERSWVPRFIRASRKRGGEYHKRQTLLAHSFARLLACSLARRGPSLSCLVCFKFNN